MKMRGVFLIILLTFVAWAGAFRAPILRSRGAITRSSLAASAADKGDDSKKSVSKADIVQKIKAGKGVDLTADEVTKVVDSFIGIVREEVLINGKEVRLRDFGTFKQKVSLPRTGRNPRTGEELQISGGKSVSFSVSNSLKIKDSDVAGGKGASASKAKAAASKAPAVKAAAKKTK